MGKFKRSQQKYVKKCYRVRNWREYEAGLRNRGSLTVWIALTDGKPSKLGCEETTKDLPKPAGEIKQPRA